MRIDRRRALTLLGLGAGAGAAPTVADAAGKVAFRHGVASGDPTQDRIVLWTRITPASDGGQVAYAWTLDPADGKAGGKRGAGVTGPDRDYTVKVDVGGLEPGRAYVYSFTSGGVTSPKGHTHTLPAGPTKDAVIATVSCALYPNGYFNAYRAIADLPRVDLVVHLGDYIYEYGGPGSYGMDSPVAHERRHAPDYEIQSLADYRTRHAQYKTDPDLQAAHARAPWVVAWDDHETANNSYRDGAENHQPEEGDWSARKARAIRAYYEWMPIREPAKGVSLEAASQRSFRIGDLASLILLETRLTARDRQLEYEDDLIVGGKIDLDGFKAKWNDPKRSIMSPAQEAWLSRELSASVKGGQAWQIIGSGVVMGRLPIPNPKDFPPEVTATYKPAVARRMARMQAVSELGLPYGLDMWDGYPADRERVYDTFRAAGARPIVISGDSHAFWANELRDAQGRRVACEFGGTSVTSPGADAVFGFKVGPSFLRPGGETKFCDQGAHGFVLLTLTRDAVKGELVGVSTIASRRFTAKALKTYRVTPEGAGISGLTEV